MKLYLLGMMLVVASGANAQEGDRVPVPAAAFAMGCSPADPECEADEGAIGGVEVSVPAFSIDRYEVTVADYAACVDAGGCSAPLGHQRNQYCNYTHPERAQHPVNCVDWMDAVAFCATRGGRLPTESAWERAERAGSLSRYPWGEEVGCEHAWANNSAPLLSPPRSDLRAARMLRPAASRYSR